MTRFLRAITVAVAFFATFTSANAAIFVYSNFLSGPDESPPNGSPGVGYAVVTYDSSLHTLRVQADFSGLTGTTTASHIHATTPSADFGTAGVATTTPTFAGFPLGVTSGTYDNTLDLTMASSYNPAFVTANGSIAASEAALVSAMGSRRAYLNIHTSTFPGGEIRGFLPEPGTLSLLVIGGLMVIRRRRQA